jgi:sensor histidine kinase YesM
MQFFNKHITTGQLLGIAWAVVFILSLLTMLQYDPLTQALTYSCITVAFYASIIYGNTYWLIPRYYARRKFAAYGLLLLCLLTVTVVARTLGSMFVYNHYFAVKPETLTARAFYFSIFNAIFIFLFSILLRLALDYFALNKKQQAIKAEQTATELNLLKQQVHPHFLFNTLNNIYYVASNESPTAADLIERLSGIMRYFIEESKKDKVLLKDEIELLKSYIELERIRMRFEMPVEFNVQWHIDSITVPPLMLLPLVENIFKHGVDKRSRDNFAEITLTIQNSNLVFTTRNRLHTLPPDRYSTKTGLANLEKRLQLYYGKNYMLTTQQQDGVFIAELQIPVHEN